MAALSPLYIGSDLDLKLTGMSAAGTGAYFNSATAGWSLADLNGTSVGSGTLDYVAASNGNYAGVIGSDVTSTLNDGDEYVLTITFTEGDYDDERVFNLFAAYRQQT